MTMSAKEVRQALTRLKKVRASRASRNPAITCIRVDVDGLHATDMDAYLRVHAETGIGAVRLADPVVIGKALKGLRAGDPVVFDAVDGSFDVCVNGTRIAGVDPADWPTTFERESNPMVPAPIGLFDAMLDVSHAAVSGDESRPVLTGVHVRVNDAGSIAVSATDSYRLARVMLHGGKALSASSVDLVDQLDHVLPVRCGKYLEAIGGFIGVGFHQSNGMIGDFFDLFGEDATLSVRRIQGTFPNVDQLLPSSWEVAGVSDGLLDPVLHVQRVGDSITPLRLTVSRDGSMVEYQDRSVEVAPMDIPGSWDCGDDVIIGLNPAMLADGLRFIGEGEPVRLISPLRPILLGDRFDRCYLQVPVRLPA